MPKPPDDALVDALAQTSYATMGVLTRLSAEHDLSLTQLRVLAILRDRRVPMAALADYLGLERSTMTGLVSRAERRGLLVRSPSPHDGRSVEVTLSDEGRALAERVGAQAREAFAALTDALDTGEQRRLADLLTRMLGPEGESGERA